MKILHIGDIHLGCTLDNQRRHEEFEKVFGFLTDQVKKERVEAALFAGDVFDSGTPSVDSQSLYFDFLLDLQAAGCRQIIAIAGNHDNANLLEAPQGLLQRMNIHVIGRPDPENLAQEVISLGSGAEEPAAIVCAVPFLRERDVRDAVPEGEDAQQKSSKLSQGILEHYRKVYELADRQRAGREIPIIAMGHFYAEGSAFAADPDGKNSSPYETVGTLEALDLKKMPEGFAYGALGHIHKPQSVPGHENWRYAGSLLKMQLRKNMYAPQVLLLDTQDLSHPKGIEIPDSCYHKMCVIEGDMAELRRQLGELAASREPVWVKPVYTGEELLLNWQIDLRLEMRDTDVQIIHPEVRRKNAEGDDPAAELPGKMLSELTPEDVFLETLNADRELTSEEQKKKLIELYRTIQNKVIDPAACEEQKTPVVPRGAMRFKKLRFRNVNSLYGEHVIDFEDSAFRNGIFLISGDTGAGKSSILDAICLALYGCTPRAEAPNKDRDDIMSEGEQELLSELTFSLGKEEYRAYFSHRRTSRSDAQKPFADSQQLLYCGGKEISGGKKTVFQKQIAQLIGLDMKQFTQCVLLAQGSFDAFLKAEMNERSGILSNITGTEVYGRIGDQINREYLKVKGDFQAQVKSNENISLLPDEKKAELVQALEDAQKQQQELEKSLRERESWLQTFNDIRKGEFSLKEAAGQREDLLRRKTEKEPERLRLDDAVRAGECQAEFLTCCHARKAVQDAEAELAGMTGKNEALREAVAEAREAQSAAGETLTKLTEEKSAKEELFREVRSLDVRCKEQDAHRRQKAKELESARETQSRHRREFQAEEKKWRSLEKGSEAAQKYLVEHDADRELEYRKALWEERRKNLVRAEKENAEKQKKADALQRELDRKYGELDPLREQERKAEKDEADLLRKRQNAEAEIKKLLDGHTEEEIDQQLISTIQSREFYKRALSYEDARKELRPGERCPLCGSPEHPFCTEIEVRENMYEQDIRRLKKTVSELKKQKNLLENGSAESAELAKRRLEVGHQRESLEQEIARRRTELEQLKNQLADELRSINEDARNLSGEFKASLQVDWADHSVLPPELQKRIDACRSALEKAVEMEKGRQQYENAKQVFAQLDPVDSAAVQDLQDQYNAAGAEFDDLTKQRKEMFEGDPDKAEKDLNARIVQAQTKLESARQKATRAIAEEENNRKNQEAQKGKLETQLRPALEQAERSFRSSLAARKFADEADFRNRLMSPEDIKALKEELQTLDFQLNGAEATLKEREKNLEETRKKLPENVREDEVSAELPGLKTAKEEADKTVQSLQVKLGQDTENRRLFAEAQQETEKIREQYSLLEYLDGHFGTGGGARFTRIAQGYTFRDLITLANRNRLGLLRQHFTLVSDRTNPLELNVIDHYRGDVVRTSRNLSGGECFEVSLALALGLAEMSSISQKASLGNVLLDEGFGTLDDKALNSALDLLMTLRSASGKLVGIISHVEKLRERIDTQINVTSSGGMGMLSGAGVTAVSRPASSVSPARRKSSGKKKTKPREDELFPEGAEQP